MLSESIALTQNPYDVLIGRGLLGRTGEFAKTLFSSSKSCAVVTDSNVGPLYSEGVCAAVREQGITPHLITVPAGEPSKSYAALEEVTRQMIRAGLDRKAFLVALGGGVIGDLAGFAAAIHFRGMPYIQAPTTVLAQVDSSVGGKTGINTPEGKNLIGAFHQPALVIADTGTLDSLPRREWNEGFAEIIKHAAIRDASLLNEIEAITGPGSEIETLIAANVRIKGDIVQADEFETKGQRALLNFGHTIGHAIEACAGYGEMLHGEAIALGMKAALHLSQKRAGLPRADADRILGLIARFQLPLQLPASMSTAAVIEKMARDKKFDQGAIRFVLLRSAGDAFVSSDITAGDIAAAIEFLR